jgi:hypothetical protein
MFRKMFFLSVLFSCLVLSACGGKPAVDVVSSEAAATKISTPTIRNMCKSLPRGCTITCVNLMMPQPWRLR